MREVHLEVDEPSHIPIIIKARCKINLKLNFEKIYFRIRIIAIVPSNVRPSPTRHKQNKLWFNSHTLDALESEFVFLVTPKPSIVSPRVSRRLWFPGIPDFYQIHE